MREGMRKSGQRFLTATEKSMESWVGLDPCEPSLVPG